MPDRRVAALEAVMAPYWTPDEERDMGETPIRDLRQCCFPFAATVARRAADHA